MLQNQKPLFCFLFIIHRDYSHVIAYSDSMPPGTEAITLTAVALGAYRRKAMPLE